MIRQDRLASIPSQLKGQGLAGPGVCDHGNKPTPGAKRALERPLHPVERALRARFRLQIQNVMGPDGSDSILSHPQGILSRGGVTRPRGQNLSPETSGV